MHADVPAEPPTDGQSVGISFQVHAHSLVLRIVSSTLRVVLAADVLFVSWFIVTFTFTGALNPTPPPLAGWFALLALALFGLLQLLRWLSAATFSVEPARFVLQRRADRFEIPLTSVESARIWRLLLPGAGVTLRMKSGRGFQYQLQIPDPLLLLEAIGQASLGISSEARHPDTAFAHARATIARRRWYQRAFKFVLFPLLPAGIMFRANQYIVYGGPFAQYQMYGLGPYLLSLFTYWAYFTALLVPYAWGWRVLFELVAFGAAWLSPRHARGARHFVEIACAVLYYAGFPALLVARFFL